MTQLINAVPVLTSDENSSIKISCSAYYLVSGVTPLYPYFAFDNNVNTGWNFEAQSPPAGGHWIKIQFKDKKRRILRIRLRNGNFASCSINNFKVSGSNDDINYTTLYTGVHAYTDADTTIGEYTLTNSDYYQFYKVTVINSHWYNNDITYGGIGELQLLESPSHFLIKQDNQYYSVKPEFYSTFNRKYVEVTLSNDLITSFGNNGFVDINDLFKITVIEGETFKPIDKLRQQGTGRFSVSVMKK